MVLAIQKAVGEDANPVDRDPDELAQTKYGQDGEKDRAARDSGKQESVGAFAKRQSLNAGAGAHKNGHAEGQAQQELENSGGNVTYKINTNGNSLNIRIIQFHINLFIWTSLKSK